MKQQTHSPVAGDAKEGLLGAGTAGMAGVYGAGRAPYTAPVAEPLCLATEDILYISTDFLIPEEEGGGDAFPW